MTESYKWWKDPVAKDDVEPYVERLLSLAGQNLWTKILKPFLNQDILKQLEANQNDGSENATLKNN